MTLYHGTTYDGALRILQHGFKGGSFTEAFENAAQFAIYSAMEGREGAIVQTELPKHLLKYYVEEDEWVLHKNIMIPGKKFRIIYTAHVPTGTQSVQFPRDTHKYLRRVR